MLRMLSGLCMAHMFSATAFAATTPTVVWLQSDWAPHQIVDGPYRGQGTFDILQQRLSALLPQYQHVSRLTSLGRVDPYFQQNRETVCITGALYTEQRAISRHYSLPTAVGPGLAINFLSQSPVASYIDDHLQIDINFLVQQPELTGAYQPNRFYPAVFTQALQQGDARLIQTEFTSELNAASLLHSQRIDYVIEYPERMQFYQLNLSEKAESIVSAAVADASPYSVSYVTCSKTPEGKKVIQDINEILPLLWAADDFQHILFFWLDNNARQLLQPKFLQLQQQILEKTSDNG